MTQMTQQQHTPQVAVVINKSISAQISTVQFLIKKIE